MFRKMFGLILTLIVFSETAGQDIGKDQAVFSRYIGSRTMLVAHYRMGELLKVPAVQSLIASVPGGQEQMEKDFRKDLGLSAKDVDTVTMFIDLPDIVDGQAKPIQNPYLLLTSKKNLDYALIRRAISPDAITIPYGAYELTVGPKQALLRVDDRTAIFLPETGGKDVEAFKKEPLLPFAKPATDGKLSAGWNQIVKHSQNKHFFMGFQFSPELRMLAETQLQNAPPMAAPFKALTKLDFAYLTMSCVSDQSSDLQMKSVLRFLDSKSAQAGLGSVKFALASVRMAVTNAGITQEPPRNQENFWAYTSWFYKKQLDQIKVEQQDQDVVIHYATRSQELLPVLQLAIEKVRLAADRMLSASNMRQLMIGMHNYHADYNHMPPVMSLKEGKPLHSWRVHILPYLEEDKLYRQLHLDEPWNSEHNRKVFESNPMPKIFEHPHRKDRASNMTCYQVFYSTTGAKKPAGFRLGVKFTLGQLTVKDGASNTVAMFENGKPVLWYKPEDIEFDADAGFPKLTTPWGNHRAQVAFFDASIRTLNLSKEEAMWKALVTWNGGEEIDLSRIEE